MRQQLPVSAVAHNPLSPAALASPAAAARAISSIWNNQAAAPAGSRPLQADLMTPPFPFRTSVLTRMRPGCAIRDHGLNQSLNLGEVGAGIISPAQLRPRPLEPVGCCNLA
jgi:hypothetical protein